MAHLKFAPGLLCFLLFALFSSRLSVSHAKTGFELVASGFDGPVCVTAPPGETNRLFIVQKIDQARYSGSIILLDRRTGATNLFLTIDRLMNGAEQGLLGLAFHPQFASNGYFYVSYVARSPGQASVIARYQANGDPLTSTNADPASAKVILRRNKPGYVHFGGWLGFGHDGFLYFSLGDNGQGTPAQDRRNLYGKISRIDIDSGENYSIPDGNPFKGDPTFAPEIWAFGLRNPWRCSFDRQTGDLWIADVGNNVKEEINRIPAGAGGVNFGWPHWEGTVRRVTNSEPVSPVTAPVHDYSYFQRAAVIGGYVYRGKEIPELQGKYVFADFGSGRYWATSRDGDTFTTTEMTSEWNPESNKVMSFPASFGEDGAGELYVCALEGGKIFKLVSIPDAAPTLSSAGLTAGGSEFVFTFPATAGQGYSILSKRSLLDSSWEVLTNLQPLEADQELVITNVVDGTERYFRVGAE